MASCENCDSNPQDFKIEAFKKVCLNCGAWVVEPDQATNFSQLYSEKYFEGDEYLNYELGKKVHAKNFDRKLKILSQFLPSLNSVRLLEIGSATGEFLKCAKAHGVQRSLGIEISDFARAQALQQGFAVRSPFDANLVEEIKSLKPNLVVLWDVWEHLETPGSLLKTYLQMTDANCIVALTTVDASSSVAKKRQEKWRQFHPPTHLNYPTQKSFADFFKKNSFQIELQEHFGYQRPLAEYIAALVGKRAWLKNSKLLFSIPLYLNLFDTQLVIAKKI